MVFIAVGLATGHFPIRPSEQDAPQHSRPGRELSCEALASTFAGHQDGNKRTLGVTLHVRNNGPAPAGLDPSIDFNERGPLDSTLDGVDPSKIVRLVDERGVSYPGHAYASFSPFGRLSPGTEKTGAVYFQVPTQHRYWLVLPSGGIELHPGEMNPHSGPPVASLPDPAIPQPAEPKPQRERGLVVEPEPAAEAPAEPAWTVAGESIEQGSIKATIAGATIEQTPIDNADLSTPGIEKSQPMLKISLTLWNTSIDKTVAVPGWGVVGQSVGQLPGGEEGQPVPAATATLTDNAGNRYEPTSTRSAVVRGRVLLPGTSTQAELWFQPPLETSEHFLLELSPAGSGGSDSLRIEIPKVMIAGLGGPGPPAVKLPAPDTAPVASQPQTVSPGLASRVANRPISAQAVPLPDGLRWQEYHLQNGNAEYHWLDREMSRNFRIVYLAETARFQIYAALVQGSEVSLKPLSSASHATLEAAVDEYAQYRAMVNSEVQDLLGAAAPEPHEVPPPSDSKPREEQPKEAPQPARPTPQPAPAAAAQPIQAAGQPPQAKGQPALRAQTGEQKEPPVQRRMRGRRSRR